MRSALHPNIYKLYAINLLVGLVFWYPIEKLFMQDIGISAFSIGINAIVYYAVLLVFDVPSGVLADKWKRKYVLCLAAIALLLSSLIGGASGSLLQYLPMTILLAVFMVLTTGTMQAMMYDSLRDSRRQSEYDKHQGRAYALFLAGLGISALAGGYMSDWFGFRSTYFVTAGVSVATVLTCLLLTEPKAHKQVADRRLRVHVRSSVRQIFMHRLLLQLCLLITAASVLRSTQNEYTGLYFLALGMTAVPVGYATAAKWIVSAFGQIIAPKIGRRALQLAPLFFLTFTAFSLVDNRWSLVFFYIAGFLFSVINNQAEAAVQDNTPSEIRATTLSVLSFSTNLLMVPLSLLFGWIAQEIDAFAAYFAISVIGLLYLMVWAVKGRKIIRSGLGTPS